AYELVKESWSASGRLSETAYLNGTEPLDLSPTPPMDAVVDDRFVNAAKRGGCSGRKLATLQERLAQEVAWHVIAGPHAGTCGRGRAVPQGGAALAGAGARGRVHAALHRPARAAHAQHARGGAAGPARRRMRTGFPWRAMLPWLLLVFGGWLLFIVGAALNGLPDVLRVLITFGGMALAFLAGVRLRRVVKEWHDANTQPPPKKSSKRRRKR